MRVHHALLFPSGVMANWAFSWPPYTDGSCRCIESSVGLSLFESQTDCLAAFVESPYETCNAITMDQCENAVSTIEGYSNAHCSGLCAEAIANPERAEKFRRECYFEFTVSFNRNSIAAPSASCFTNYVYGHSDYNPNDPDAEKPLNWFSDVPSAAKCQELCQDTDQCALWTWRGAEDSANDSSSQFQNDRFTCILRSESYVDRVLSVKVEDELPTDRRYCDFERVTECSSDPFDRASINPLHPHACLMCDCIPRCVFESPAHISGPVQCPAEAQITERDLCHLYRPSWTTTEPPCPTIHDLDRGWFSKNPLFSRNGGVPQNEGEPTEAGDMNATMIAETSTAIILDSSTTGLLLDTEERGGLLERVASWF